MSNTYGAAVVSCIRYHSDGLVCDVCSRDPRLKGPWTKTRIKNFNYHKVKVHIIDCDGHKKRLTAEEKAVHPSFKTNDAQSNAPSPTASPLEKIIKGIACVLLVIKEGLPLNKVPAINEFVDEDRITRDLKTPYHTDHILNAMDIHQRKLDLVAIFGEDRSNPFSLAFDGVTHSRRSVKIFDLKAVNESGPITKYGCCLSGKKSIRDVDVDLSDLLTVDNGADNRRLVVKACTEEFGVTDWRNLVQLCADGAGQNMGEYTGCVELVSLCLIQYVVFHRFRLKHIRNVTFCELLESHFRI